VLQTESIDDLHLRARACLQAGDPAAKCALTHATALAYRTGRLRADPARAIADEGLVPGRPSRPQLVEPRALSARGLGTVAGRAAFVHAIAHIEFNAIDLAWDAVYRFRGMPDAFYADWIGVADDEARHFALLDARLNALGHAYGDFDAHNGLWDMAERTAHSCLARMALVPRVLEARGLDVTPAMITRLKAVGDGATADILALILREEVAHVAVGSRWFLWCCRQAGVDPRPTFAALVQAHAGRSVRGPFNRPARIAAGFTEEEMLMLETLSGPAA
jgi:uncharacterized ferritin-like protein (DUF455 family)